MSIRIKHVVPDYFPEFKCLADKCNYTCCYQWRVEINRSDYMKLKNLRAEKEIKEKLSSGIRRVKNPSTNFYAQMIMGEDENCPFFGKDKLCTLQQAHGYGVLPAVCKVFPRITHSSPVQWEETCTTGCEQVVNLLLERPEGLRMIEIETKEKPYMDQEYAAKKFEKRPALQFYKEIQMLFMGILQNRKYSLSQRILLLGLAAQDLNKVQTVEQAIAFIKKSLSLLQYSPELEQQLNDLQKNALGGAQTVFEQLFGYNDPKAVKSYDKYFDDIMKSAKENLNVQILAKKNTETREIKLSFSVDEQKYNEAKQHFQQIEKADYLMENVMVNQMLYTQFPLEWLDDTTSVWDHYLNFVLQYNIFTVLCTGYMADKTDIQLLVQCITSCSRNLTHAIHFCEDLVNQWKDTGFDTLAHIAYFVS